MVAAPTRKVLFVCTGNACRSQMAEALLAHHGSGRFEAYSAGVQPAGFVHPLAIDAMKSVGVAMPFAESKGLEGVSDQTFDAVITLCDVAAGVIDHAAWSGHPHVAHWPLPDPVAHPGTPQERAHLAQLVARRLDAKVRGLIALDWSGADRATLQEQLDRLGQI